MASPFLNMLSYWFFWAASVVMLTSLFIETGPASGGWTIYPPLSALGDANLGSKGGMDYWITSMALFVISALLGGLNYITTILNMRTKGMSMTRLPLTIWALFFTAILGVLSFPVLLSGLILLLFDRHAGTSFYLSDIFLTSTNKALPNEGGSPILFQHLFWFLGHPEVYIIILPAMGLVSEVMAINSRKPIFGYMAMIGSLFAITILAFLVWAHHMFVTGLNPFLGSVFVLLTLLIAVPSAIKVFNWISTMHQGSLDLQTPFYWAIAFIFVFMIGGFSGLILGSLAANVHLHNTHFVVAHFHFIVFGGTGFAFFGAMHYWYPKITGKMYDPRWANIGLVLFFIGFITLYGPMFYLGFKGMPRRYYDYDEVFHAGNIISTMGSWVLYSGLAIIIINLFASLKNGIKAPSDPWGGKTLEWTIPSPPPVENFNEIPVISKGPYDYK